MVVPQVGQVVGEVGEVVADADLQVVADATIDPGQRAAAALTDIREVEHSHLGHTVPVLAEPPVQAQHCEVRIVGEEVQLCAIKARLSQAVGVLAADRPVGRDVVGKIQRRDVALLNELDRSILHRHLVRGRDVIEVRVLWQGA